MFKFTEIHPLSTLPHTPESLDCLTPDWHRTRTTDPLTFWINHTFILYVQSSKFEFSQQRTFFFHRNREIPHSGTHIGPNDPQYY